MLDMETSRGPYAVGPSSTMVAPALPNLSTICYLLASMERPRNKPPCRGTDKAKRAPNKKRRQAIKAQRRHER